MENVASQRISGLHAAIVAVCLAFLAVIVATRLWRGERCKPLPSEVRRQLTDALQRGGVVQIPSGCWKLDQ